MQFYITSAYKHPVCKMPLKSFGSIAAFITDFVKEYDDCCQGYVVMGISATWYYSTTWASITVVPSGKVYLTYSGYTFLFDKYLTFMNLVRSKYIALYVNVITIALSFFIIVHTGSNNVRTDP